MSGLGPWRGGSRGSGGFGTPFSSDVWDPFDLNPSTWSGGGGGHIDPRDDTAALAHAHVDWRETDNAHIFRADLPGVKKEEVKVLVEDGNVLQIGGERTKEQENTNDKWHRVERRRGSFTRKFRLPENANAEEIKCGLENGVLTVTVPKKKSAQETPKNVKYIDVA